MDKTERVTTASHQIKITLNIDENVALTRSLFAIYMSTQIREKTDKAQDRLRFYEITKDDLPE